MKKRLTLLTISALAIGTMIGGCGKNKEADNIQPIKDTVTTELGEEMSTKAADYVTGEKDILKDTKVDVSKVDVTNIGTYDMTVTYDKEVEKIKVEVKDTVAPEVTTDELHLQAGQPFDITSAVSVKEYSGNVTLSVTDHAVTAEEVAGTEEMASTEEAVSTEEATEAVDSTEVVKGEKPLKVNTVYIQYDEAGEYDNTLTATDDSGNKSETSIHIVVEAAADGELVTPEETETVASNDNANEPKKNTGNDSKNATTNDSKPVKGNTSGNSNNTGNTNSGNGNASSGNSGNNGNSGNSNSSAGNSSSGNTSTPTPEPTPAPAPEPTPAPEPAKNLCPYTLYQVMDLGDGTMGYYEPRYAEYQDLSAFSTCMNQLGALGYTYWIGDTEVGTYDDTSTVLLCKYKKYEG